MSSLTSESQAGTSINPKIFSRFQHTYRCVQSDVTHTTWIEPLSHGLRDPNSLCGRGAVVLDRGYLLFGFQADTDALSRLDPRRQCKDRKCMNIYVDVGATMWGQGGPEEPGQSWFVRTYQRHGIAFDRMFMWEARSYDPNDLSKSVPRELMPTYQYYNVPASPDPDDPSSPVGVLRRVAQPGDFVVFKLDIDNGTVDNGTVDSILTNPEVASLIDVFLFEHHINFAPML